MESAAPKPATDPHPCIELESVSRRYGRRVALDGVGLTVAPGEIVGVVGANGAGKTTLFRLLAGLQRPSAGRVRVFGLEPFRERDRVARRARFAFVPPALFGALTAEEHVRLLGALGRARRERPSRAEAREALARVGLADRAADRVRGFSTGMRQRLLLATALVPLPELLVLDEPTDGLDPLAVLEMRAVLRQLRDEHGVALVLSSHLFVEVDELVDRLLVLAEGRCVFAGTPAELTADGRRLRLEVDGPEPARAALAERGIAAEVAGAEALELAPDALTLEEAAALLGGAGIRLRGYHVVAPSLESALLERLRGGEGRR